VTQTCASAEKRNFIVYIFTGVTKMQKQAELYRGKAKPFTARRIRICWYSNSVTILQQGMRARIEQFDRKGMVNNKFNHFIMSKLEEAGIPTQMEALLRYRMSGKNWRWFRWSA
jgi:phosphoribosylaminoimidazole-succinocarboxamide synthase